MGNLAEKMSDKLFKLEISLQAILGNWPSFKEQLQGEMRSELGHRL